MKKIILFTLIGIIIIFSSKVNALSVDISGPGDVEPLTSFDYNYGATFTGLPSGSTIQFYQWTFNYLQTGYFTINNNWTYTSYNANTFDSQNVRFYNVMAPIEIQLEVKVEYRDAANNIHDITTTKVIHLFGICSSFFIEGPSSILKCTQPTTQYSASLYCSCVPWNGMCNNLTFAWSLPSGWIFNGPSNTPTISVIPSQSTGGNVSCTVTRNGNITKTASISVNRNEPNQHLDGLSNICPNSTQIYTISSEIPLNGGTYLWQATGGYLILKDGVSIGSKWVTSLTTNNTSVTVLAPSSFAQGTIIVSNVTGNLCHNITNNVTNYAAPARPSVPNITPSSHPFCRHDIRTFSINPVPGASSYNWSFAPLNGAPANGIFLDPQGTYCDVTFNVYNAGYIVYVSASNNCGTSSTNSKSFYIDTQELCNNKDLISSINKIDLKNNISIYPNPANNGIFNISITDNTGNESKSNIIVYDVMGKTIYDRTSVNLANEKIDLSNNAKGIYFIKITNGEQTYMDKLIYQ